MSNTAYLSTRGNITHLFLTEANSEQNSERLETEEQPLKGFGVEQGACCLVQTSTV